MTEEQANQSSNEPTASSKALARWLVAKGSGCFFAALIAKQKELYFTMTVTRQLGPEVLDLLLDGAGARGQPALIVFPAIRSESDLIQQLNRLATGARWWVEQAPRPSGVDTLDVFVRILWETNSGVRSSVMGLGPFPTMPVTRRAPFVALALWPGGQENPFNQFQKDDRVDFLDTKHDHDAARYENLWDNSVQATRELLAEPPDSPKHYRDVAFRLHASAGPMMSGKSS